MNVRVWISFIVSFALDRRPELIVGFKIRIIERFLKDVRLVLVILYIRLTLVSLIEVVIFTFKPFRSVRKGSFVVFIGVRNGIDRSPVARLHFV